MFSVNRRPVQPSRIVFFSLSLCSVALWLPVLRSDSEPIPVISPYPRASPPRRAAALVPGDDGCSCVAPPSDAAWATPEAAAVIVEPRVSPALSLALRHMAETLPQSWVFVLVGRRNITEWVAAEMTSLLVNGRLHVWELAHDSYAITRICPGAAAAATGPGGCAAARVMPAVYDARASPARAGAAWPRDYALANVVQVRPELYLAIPTEKFIVFQTDGMLCAPLNASALRSYFRFDFVGAPWPEELFYFGKFPRGAGVGGNGGFSLRSSSVLQRVISDLEYDVSLPEDIWLSHGVAQIGGRLPSFDEAQAFSLEIAISADKQQPLGFHKPWAYLSVHDWEAFASMCPIAMQAHLANRALVGYTLHNPAANAPLIAAAVVIACAVAALALVLLARVIYHNQGLFTIPKLPPV